MPSTVPMLAWHREDHPDVQGRLGCTRLLMAPQPPSVKNGTLQSDVDIPRERDRHYGPTNRSDDDDDDDDDDIYLYYAADTNCVPRAQTFKSQKPRRKVIFNCTMTYLAGWRLAALHRILTVAPAVTWSGYSPHTTYCPRTGGEIKAETFDRPIVIFSDCWSAKRTYATTSDLKDPVTFIGHKSRRAAGEEGDCSPLSRPKHFFGQTLNFSCSSQKPKIKKVLFFVY